MVLLPVLYWVKLVKLGSKFVVGSLFWTAADGSPSGLWGYRSSVCVQGWFKTICFLLACSLFGLQCDPNCIPRKRKAEHTDLRIDPAVASVESDHRIVFFFST